MKLSQIPGVGTRTSEKLESNGYRRVEQVAYANLSTLDEIDGVGPKTIIGARNLLGIDEEDTVGFDTVKAAQEELDLNGNVLDAGDKRFLCEHCESQFAERRILEHHENKNCRYNPANIPDRVKKRKQREQELYET